MTKSGLTGDWDGAARQLRAIAKLSKLNMNTATRQNAISLRDGVKRTIYEGRPGWSSLSSLTIARKGSSRPLVDKGDLANAVVGIPVSPTVFWAGVPKAPGARGFTLADIATVMEFGAPNIRPKRGRALAIPVSRKASRLYAQYGSVASIPDLFRPKGKDVLMRETPSGPELLFVLKTRVSVPARPFMQPTVEDMKRQLYANWRAAAAATMKGHIYYGG